MRHLFDTKKEHKSIKLVKKLQEEADKEWENEITRRREQELNDEAIAKELQAQLELESSGSGSNANSPPPLPTKPRAYNSSINISSHAASSSTSPTNYSTNSLPTTSTSPFATKPLYSISSTNNNSQPALPPRDQNVNSKKPVKSYLNNSNERYKPELQFALASPAPCPSSVFYQKTPKMTPAITPLKALDTSSSNLYNGNKTPTSPSTCINTAHHEPYGNANAC
ncbi:hypothetical protein G6F42_023568 [Rhizopus arrhizus]|nr:hypothetical protein G6F42_023568 [Rhizopus arrhizus]